MYQSEAWERILYNLMESARRRQEAEQRPQGIGSDPTASVHIAGPAYDRQRTTTTRLQRVEV